MRTVKGPSHLNGHATDMDGRLMDGRLTDKNGRLTDKNGRLTDMNGLKKSCQLGIRSSYP